MVSVVSELDQREGHADDVGGLREHRHPSRARDVLEVVSDWQPDVVVRESQEYAGALAAERHGIPHVRVALGLASHEDETLSIVAATVDELRRELGLDGDPDARKLRESPYFTLMPGLLERPGAPAPRDTHRFRDARNEARPFPDWWESGNDPLVYLSFGSVAGRSVSSPASTGLRSTRSPACAHACW